MQLILGCLIKWIGQEGVERALCYHPGGSHYYCIAVDPPNAWPFARPCTEIVDAINDRRAVIIDRDPWAAALQPESMLSERHRKMRDNAYEVIRELVEDPRRLVYDRKTSGAEIRRAAGAHSVKAGCARMHITTIYKYLRRFWQRGAVKNALQPDLGNCGGRGKPGRLGAKKLGDVNINGEHVGINVTEQVAAHFKYAIAKYYHSKQQRNTFVRSFELMLEDHYTERYTILNGRRAPRLLPPHQTPTLAQYRYYYDKHYRKVQSLRARMGATYVEQNCRAVTRDQTKSALGIGDIYQIDATTADVHLVMSSDKDVVVGRPIVYLVLDAYSELVAGVHVTFDDMSYNAVAMAIWNAYTDKVQFCESLGVPGISPEHWPSKGLPASLFADRGELCSRISDVVARNLNIRLANAPAYCPTAKAIVERHFGLINGAVIRWLPGAIPDGPNWPRKGDYRKKAALTKEEFLEALVHAILAYNTSMRTDYKRTEAMIRDHVEPVPCKIWEWGLANRPQLHNNDSRMVRLGLLPVKSGTVLRDGISVGTLRYTCAKARLGEWFDFQKGFNKSWKVNCSYDPNMTDHVYLLGRTFAEAQICDLTEAYTGFSGWTWAEVEKYREHEAKYLLARQEDDRQARIAAQSAIRQITATAEARRKQSGPADVTQVTVAKTLQQVRDGQKDSRETMEMVGAVPLQGTPASPPQYEEGKVAADWTEICAEMNRNGKRNRNHEVSNSCCPPADTIDKPLSR
jgi:putative transposase